MKAKKALNVILSVVLWIVILLAAFFAFTTLATRNSNSVASLGGFTPLTVESESMSPTFNQGDMIIIKKVDTSTLKEGDIITFHTIIENRYALNTHRIVKIEQANGYRTYETKGDNNMISDRHIISDNDIVGKYVTRLPGFGKVINFLSTSAGFFIVIVLPMLAFFIYQVYHLIVVSARLKKATAAEAAAEIDTSAREAEAKAKEAEAKLAELERLTAEYEAKIAEAEKLKEQKKDNE